MYLNFATLNNYYFKS